MTCDHCGTPLTGQQKRWCAVICERRARYARQPARQRRYRYNRLTQASIDAAKERYPSLTRDWDVGMVDDCAGRLLPLLTRKLERLGSVE